MKYYDRNPNNQLLIDEGKIWKNEQQKWYRKCPICSKVLFYLQRSHCIDLYNKNKSCISCSKLGKNNHFYGKPCSLQRRQRISKSHFGLKCSIETRQKISKTKRENNDGILSQNGANQFAWKTYTFPSGRSERVQGYEPWTLDLLLSEARDENDIKIHGRPIIPYNHAGLISRYLPDCYLSSSNIIVETKSPWTWKLGVQQNMEKITGSLAAGFDVRVVIWARYHKLISDVTYTSTK